VPLVTGCAACAYAGARREVMIHGFEIVTVCFS